jgi:GT2 family glycosyltransferase
MRLSFIIVNYKTKNLVKNCLKNIEKLNLDFEYEMIVIDNHSGDGLSEMLREKFSKELETGKLQLIESPKNIGMGSGNNLGVKRASGQYIMIINPDVAVLPGSIENLIDFAEKKEGIGCLAPRLLNPNKTIQQSCYQFPNFLMPILLRTGFGIFGQKKLEKYMMSDKDFSHEVEVDWVRGAAMFFRKSFYEDLGGFDERFFMYMEDVDICRRIHGLDRKVWYFPKAEMVHYYLKESDTGKWIKDLFGKMAWLHIFSWLKYFWKWKLK